MTAIRTIAITAPGKVENIGLEISGPTGREVLVKVHAVALCTLEQRIFKGDIKMPYPCIGGHEVSGEIAELGPSVNRKLWKVGDRVAVRMLYACGECHQCRSGHTNACEHAQKKPVREGMLPGPGGLCDYVIVESSSLFPVADTISYEEASLTEPLACVVHSIYRAQISLADTVVVIGGGIMGQFHVMLARMRGARVIMSEPHAGRRALAEEYGAFHTIDPSKENPEDTVKQLTDGRGADIVFNTTPVAEVIPQALGMLAKNGKMIQYSSMHPDIPTSFSPQNLHNGEMMIVGSISPCVEDFYTANRLISYGIVDCRKLISDTFTFREAKAAFEKACSSNNFRIIITD